MNDVFLVGPALTKSGYGAHFKDIFLGLEQFDCVSLYLNFIRWGHCAYIDSGEYKDKLLRYAFKAAEFTKRVPLTYPDLTVHLTVPPEFHRIPNTKYVGVTAGIEADGIHPDWIAKINDNCDHLVVPSTFVRDVMKSANYEYRNKFTGESGVATVTAPITVIPESVDIGIYNPQVECKLDLNFETDFNFLCVGQWGMNGGMGEERKNISSLIKWFKEAFKDNKNVGLVLKTNMINNSLLDGYTTSESIENIIRSFKLGSTPKIYLIHDYLSEEQIAQLYRHPKIKVYISLSHGESWGRPLIEAAACGLPVMTVGWGGQSDFMDLGKYIKFEHTMTEVPKHHIGNLFYNGVKWASPIEEDVKKKMRRIVENYSIPKEWAMSLSNKIIEKFNIISVSNMWRDFYINNGLIDLSKKDKLMETIQID